MSGPRSSNLEEDEGGNGRASQNAKHPEITPKQQPAKDGKHHNGSKIDGDRQPAIAVNNPRRRRQVRVALEPDLLRHLTPPAKRFSDRIAHG